MKSLVVYSSQSGNTQKLAQAVFDTLVGNKDIFAVDEAPDPDAYDFVSVGFWLQAGKPDPKSAEFIGRVGPKPLFLFATHGAAAGSDHAINAMTFARSLAPSAQIVGSFSCPGEVNPKVLEKVRGKPQLPAWLADAADAAGRPDETDISLLKHELSELLVARNNLP